MVNNWGKFAFLIGPKTCQVLCISALLNAPVGKQTKNLNKAGHGTPKQTNRRPASECGRWECRKDVVQCYNEIEWRSKDLQLCLISGITNSTPLSFAFPTLLPVLRTFIPASHSYSSSLGKKVVLPSISCTDRRLLKVVRGMLVFKSLFTRDATHLAIGCPQALCRSCASWRPPLPRQSFRQVQGSQALHNPNLEESAVPLLVGSWYH